MVIKKHAIRRILFQESKTKVLEPGPLLALRFRLETMPEKRIMVLF